ncbi:MAG: glycosyltransferase [Candidatus Pacebacteria bacterium]|nr:glycosyltransferase [Candidatus Paceibacterota bacterium]
MKKERSATSFSPRGSNTPGVKSADTPGVILQPLVSVIMPVYNSAGYVVEAIESLLNQTYPNLEIVIVDDASTDKTGRILVEFKKLYPQKIRLIRLSQNLGQGGDSAANVAYQHCRGEFIARMDADDIAKPERIQTQINFFQKHPELTVLGTNAEVINSQGQVVGEKKVPLKHEDIYRAYFSWHPMINPSLMFRRSHLPSKKNLYSTANPTNNDYHTLMRMISRGAKFSNLPQKLIYYRIHEKNDSLIHVRRMFKNTLRTRFRAVGRFGYQASLIGWFVLLAQMILVYLLPEKIMFQLYLVLRGFNKYQLASSWTAVKNSLDLKKLLTRWSLTKT